MTIGVIIAAAGHARRYLDSPGAVRHKLDEDLGGRPLLQRTVELFNKHDSVHTIIVAGPAEDQAWNEFRMRYADKLAIIGAALCRGGTHHRWETIKAAIEHVPAECTHIAVHDAARPCASPELIDRVFAAAERWSAVVPCMPIADTLKRLSEPEQAPSIADPLADILGLPAKPAGVQFVRETIDRAGVVAVQTPQVFEASLLRRAYAQDDLASTDDATLIERLGERVLAVEGDPRNIKITVPADLVLARAILGFKPPAEREVHKRF
ncbi:MAG: 2-C-methyl-D-erythritol 4-phosphate cytidylyltransferase [Phycisphaeraceae bacterium]|nr:2-C-methyl-D-erythritol 4-phosphate cytidylyltransferase [Phycisphaeraceae bacterium]MCW5754869.1 2-C-methyl-D-erythritol 4-phosphate cytidylyltransferase [Phycisphaeraceae bacterium]